MATLETLTSRQLLAVIGDEDTVTGLLLAGIGQPVKGEKNFLVVDGKTNETDIEATFDRFIFERNDIAIVLITQDVANRIRAKVDSYTAPIPALLEIPSKDHPYDPTKDSVMKRVNRLLGE